MAFRLPHNVPQFDNNQRDLEDVYFSQTKRGGRDLPMYKDKPYNWSGGPSAGPFWRRKRVIAILLLLVIGVFFWQNGERQQKTGRSKWTWKSKSGKIWEARAEEVKMAFDLSWNRYVKYAWGKDRFAPISKKAERIGDAGLGIFAIGALDTLMIMNKTAELAKAQDWVATFLTGDQNVDVDIFEIESKVVGGLLAANYLVTEAANRADEDDEEHASMETDLFIEKAVDIADRLSGGWESPTMIPWQTVNLDTRKPSGKIVATGSVGAMQLEVRDLAKNIGEGFFWTASETVAETLSSLSRSGLISSTLSPGSRRVELSEPVLDGSTMGYYETLLKQYLQSSKQEPIYLELWHEALATIKTKYVAYTRYTNLPVITKTPYKPDSDSVRMAEATCTLPGLIALSLTSGKPVMNVKQGKSWSKDKDAELEFAKRLMKTCWAIHTSQATGLAPVEVSILAREATAQDGPKEVPLTMSNDITAASGSEANYQSPATLESLYYMYTITGDETYRKWGWSLFESYRNHTLGPAGEGFYGLEDVTTVPPKVADRLNDLWFSKTMKFFYLLFSDNHTVELDKVVFNAAGHILPRFKLQRGLKTGWKRKVGAGVEDQYDNEHHEVQHK